MRQPAITQCILSKRIRIVRCRKGVWEGSFWDGFDIRLPLVHYQGVNTVASSETVRRAGERHRDDRRWDRRLRQLDAALVDHWSSGVAHDYLARIFHTTHKTPTGWSADMLSALRVRPLTTGNLLALRISGGEISRPGPGSDPHGSEQGEKK